MLSQKFSQMVIKVKSIEKAKVKEYDHLTQNQVKSGMDNATQKSDGNREKTHEWTQSDANMYK